MQLRKIIQLLLGASTFLQTLNAYVCEYKSFYRLKTGTRIDLLYDNHIPVPDFTIDQFLKLDYKAAVARLYPTERKVLNTLKKLDNTLKKLDRASSACDLIWETANTGDYKCIPGSPCFIALIEFLGLSSLQHVRFIAADKNRHFGFNSLFRIKQGDFERSSANLTKCSFENPIPLSGAMVRKIRVHSGRNALKLYKELRTATVKKLKSSFSKAYATKEVLDYTKDIYNNDTFNSLCDLEILSHILSSDAPRVIVYAGGWHCEHVTEFLERAGFKVLLHEHTAEYGDELPLRGLAQF